MGELVEFPPPVTVGDDVDQAARHAAKQRMRAQINRVAGHRNAIDAEIVDIAAALLADPTLFSGEGTETPEKFLAWRFGMSRQAAGRYVDVARRAHEMPATLAALRAGEIALDQVMPIVRHVPAWAEAQVLRQATKLLASQVSRLAASYRFQTPEGEEDTIGHPTAHEPAPTGESDRTAAGSDADADADADAVADVAGGPDETDPADPADTVGATEPPEPGAIVMPGVKDRGGYWIGDDGRFRMWFETDRGTGEVIANALGDARDRLFRTGHHDATAVDAMVSLAEGHLARADEPGRRARTHLLMHVHDDGSATDRTGRPLPDAVRRWWSCDGIVNPVLHQQGRPVSVGRAQRIVPERTRNVVLHRDGGCRVPGCGETHHLEIHHVVHWEDDGPTDTWNLVALCPRHHRMHHQGRLGIAGDADAGTLRFTTPGGRDLARSGPEPTRPDGPAPPGRYRPPRGETLDPRWVSFTHPARLRRPRTTPPRPA